MSEKQKLDCPLCGSEIHLEKPPQILLELFHAGELGLKLAKQLFKFVGEVYEKREPRLSQLAMVNVENPPNIWIWAGATPENPIARIHAKNQELTELRAENEQLRSDLGASIIRRAQDYCHEIGEQNDGELYDYFDGGFNLLDELLVTFPDEQERDPWYKTHRGNK